MGRYFNSDCLLQGRQYSIHLPQIIRLYLTTIRTNTVLTLILLFWFHSLPLHLTHFYEIT